MRWTFVFSDKVLLQFIWHILHLATSGSLKLFKRALQHRHCSSCLVQIRLNTEIPRQTRSVQWGVKTHVSTYLVVSGLRRRRVGEGGVPSLTPQMMLKQAEAEPQERSGASMWPWSVSLPPYGTVMCKCQPVCCARAKHNNSVSRNELCVRHLQNTWCTCFSLSSGLCQCQGFIHPQHTDSAPPSNTDSIFVDGIDQIFRLLSKVN